MNAQRAIVAGVAAASVWLAGCGAADVPSAPPAAEPVASVEEGATTLTEAQVRAGFFGMHHTDLTVDQIHAFKEFPAVWLGESFHGYNLTSILRDSYEQEQPTGYKPVKVDALSFIYGSCDPSGDTGCAPPLEVQIWPSCLKPLSETAVPEGVPSETQLVAGVPTLRLPDHLELATGEETVLIFGDTEELRYAAAESLRYVDRPTARLAAPLPGVLKAGDDCG